MSDSPTDPILRVPDAEQTGERTQSRFRFQSECAARVCIAMLAGEEVAAVVCEKHEDHLAFFDGGEVELVSVKHREASQGPWRLPALINEGGVGHLYDRWAATRERAKAVLMTNAGLAPGPAQAAALAEACSSGDGDRIEAFVPAVGEKLLGSDDQVRRFLRGLRVEAGLPSREHITAQNVATLLTPALDRLGLGPGDAPSIYERLVHLIEEAQRARAGALDSMLQYVADPGRLNAGVRQSRALAAKTLDRRTVTAALVAAPAALPRLTPLVEPPRARTSLQRKLEAGGVGATTVESAKRLRASWSQFESSRRAIIPGGDPEFEDLRARVLRLVSRSETRTAGAESYGQAMQRDLDETLTVTALARPSAFALDSDLLMGLVYELTDECSVWFSDRSAVHDK